jgi:Sedlin, N-terminal conserved region
MSLLGLAIIGRRNDPLYLCDCVRVLREAKQQQPGRRTPPPPRRALSDTSSAGGGAGDASTTTTSDLEGAATNDEAGSSSAADNAQEDKAGITAQQQSKHNEPPVLHDDDTTEEGNSDDTDPFGFKEARQNCDLGQSLSFEQSLHLHSALDHVEERIETSAAGLPVVTSGRTGHWLGLLACHDDDDAADDAEEGPHVVYGYITATNVKLLVMVRPPVPKESNVRLFLNGIHDTFITHSMNPFSSVKPGQRITSKRFDANIREAVRDYEDNRIQQ